MRVLFCLFAEDTGIFERDAFSLYIENRTSAGRFAILGRNLARLFEVLDTPAEKRQKNLDETLAAFPYVNGELFAEKLGFADFNRDMRNSLLACTRFDWSTISPAIFGSLFQGIMEPRERRQIGGHYTSERDILKVIRALFLDDLRAEFDRIKTQQESTQTVSSETCQAAVSRSRVRLRQLSGHCLSGIALAGNRRAYSRFTAPNSSIWTFQSLPQVDVDAFYGIEISEWPARIAEVAMWLMDHQMNVRLSEVFGQYFVRLPLKKSPTIVLGNALRLDWKEILPPEKCSYVLGNPPFVGKQYQTRSRRATWLTSCANFKNVGDLDYVAGWFKRAAEYIQELRIRVGFVSTNSITPGRAGSARLGRIIRSLRAENPFCPSDVCMGERSRGAKPMFMWSSSVLPLSPERSRSGSSITTAGATEPVESVVSHHQSLS